VANALNIRRVGCLSVVNAFIFIVSNFYRAMAMTRKEHLLTILSEECAEVSQRVSKALRFGLGEVQPGQEADNADEYSDLVALYEMLRDEGILPDVDAYDLTEKKEKVEKFLKLSLRQGTLCDG